MGESDVRIPVDPQRAVVYEHGWQSWSPTAAYRVDQRPFRPVSEARRVGNYRPERTAPHEAFWGTFIVLIGIPGYLYWKRSNRKAVSG